MECSHNVNASEPTVLQNLMRDLAIRKAASANAASTDRRSGQSIAPPVVAPADVFGPYGEQSWDPVGDAEFEARVARRLALEAQRGKRKRSGVTRKYNIRNPHYQGETDDSEDESFCQRTKRQNPGSNLRQ